MVAPLQRAAAIVISVIPQHSARVSNAVTVAAATVLISYYGSPWWPFKLLIFGALSWGARSFHTSNLLHPAFVEIRRIVDDFVWSDHRAVFNRLLHQRSGGCAMVVCPQILYLARDNWHSVSNA